VRGELGRRLHGGKEASMNFSCTFTTKGGPGSLSITASVEVADNDADPVGRIRALLDQVLGNAGLVPRVGNGKSAAVPQASVPSPAPTHNGNGNGHIPVNGNSAPSGEARISPKQRGFLLGLAAKQGLKAADLNERAKARFGADATLANLSKAEASALIEELKAEAPAAKGE